VTRPRDRARTPIQDFFIVQLRCRAVESSLPALYHPEPTKRRKKEMPLRAAPVYLRA
jgi:hypothetical protein